MRLTRKFIAALVVSVALVAMIQGFFDYRRERAVFDSQMRAEATALGREQSCGGPDTPARAGDYYGTGHAIGPLPGAVRFESIEGNLRIIDHLEPPCALRFDELSKLLGR